MPAPDGKCRICGAYGPLTYEHIPPEAAFNDKRILLADTKALLASKDWASFEEPKGRWQQRGAGDHTLCASCNSKTGGWYGSQYVEWAAQGMRQLVANGAIPPVQAYDICPLHVLKQILSLFCSACGPEFAEADHELRRLLLNKEERGLPAKYRLYAYLIDLESKGTRQSGITAALSGGHTQVFAEIAFPPFGYFLTFDSRPEDAGLCDITHFKDFSWKERRYLQLSLPVRQVNSYFPGDFRTLQKIRDDYLANTLRRR
jgi:hypothetical protein